MRDSYYPVFLDIKDRVCVVVGGGSVAERKVLSLLRAGAFVKVISPELTKRLEKEKSKGRIKHIKRRYRKGDLKDAFLVIVATDSPEENKKIATEKPALINVVDTPELCTFIVPSTVKRGPLTIAISTSGTSPALAKAIRKELEALYGKQFGAYLTKIKRLRAKAIKEIKDKKERERFLKSLASAKIIKTLRGKQS